MEAENIKFLKDNEEIVIPHGQPISHMCCGCGLVHTIKASITVRGIVLQFEEDEETTKACRDRLKEVGYAFDREEVRRDEGDVVSSPDGSD